LPPLDAELQYRIKSEGEAALVEISARRRSDLGRIRGSQERMLLLALVSPRTHLIALGARLRSQFIDGSRDDRLIAGDYLACRHCRCDGMVGTHAFSHLRAIGSPLS
jgi:hypothetical protein